MKNLLPGLNVDMYSLNIILIIVTFVVYILPFLAIPKNIPYFIFVSKIATA
jgi:hypothetical protein